MKIVINKCYGGFGLSVAALSRIAELRGVRVFFYTRNYSGGMDRNVRLTGEGSDKLSVYPITADLGDSPTDDQLNKAEWLKLEDDRADPSLVQVVEELGDKANGRFANLKIVEIPNEVEYTIEDYDGMEHVAQVHDTWG